MSQKNQWLLNIVMVFLSWITIPFLGRETIKRFSPAAIFVFLICCIDVQVGKKNKWWSFYNKNNFFIPNELPFLIGPFLAGSMWTLKWTYGNFKTFIVTNAIMEAIFAFPITRLFTKLKVYKLKRFNEFQFFLFFFYKAFCLYGFQIVFEKWIRPRLKRRID
jgi:hypothetical protein